MPRTAVLRVLSVQLCFVRDSTCKMIRERELQHAGAPGSFSLQQQLQQERTSILFSVDGEDLSQAVLGGAEENSRGRRVPGDTESVPPAGRRVLALGGLRGTRRGDGRKKFAEVGPDVAVPVHVRGSGAAHHHHDDNNIEQGLVAAAIPSSSAVEREKPESTPKTDTRHTFGLVCLNLGMLCKLLSWTPQLIFNMLDTRQLPTLSLLTQCLILGTFASSIIFCTNYRITYKTIATSLQV